jgi:hypothetical protein
VAVRTLQLELRNTFFGSWSGASLAAACGLRLLRRGSRSPGLRVKNQNGSNESNYQDGK